MLHQFEASFNYPTAKTLCNGQSSRKVAVTVLEWKIIELYNFNKLGALLHSVTSCQ